MGRNGMTFEFSHYIDIDGKDEMEIEIEVTGYHPPIPAKISGRPEDSYPGEGSEWNDITMYIITFDKILKRNKRVELPVEFADEFMKKYGEDEFWDLIDEQAQDASDAEYDAAMDRKYQEMKDERHD